MIPSGWFVVATKPKCEERARDELLGENMDVFLPLLARRLEFHSRPGRPRTGARAKVAWVAEPLYPRYLFVLLGEDSEDGRSAGRQMAIVNAARNVVEVLRSPGDCLVPVRSSLIDMLRERISVDIGAIKAPDPKGWLPGDKVRVDNDPLYGHFQAVVHASGPKRSILLAQFIGGIETRITIATKKIRAA